MGSDQEKNCKNSIGNSYHCHSAHFSLPDTIKRQMNNLSTDEQIDYLYALIDQEITKDSTDIDEDLIFACRMSLDSLLAEKTSHITTDHIKKIQTINALRVALNGDNQKQSTRILVPHISKRFLAAIASIITVFALLTITAFATQIPDMIIEWFQKISIGESETLGNITFIRPEYSTQYKTIDELFEKEELDIMYPTKLPEGKVFKQIIVTPNCIDPQYIDIQFITDDPVFSITVSTHFSVDLSDDNHALWEYNDYLIYIAKHGESSYLYTWQSGEYEYQVNCNNAYDAELVIKNMKGMN